MHLPRQFQVHRVPLSLLPPMNTLSGSSRIKSVAFSAVSRTSTSRATHIHPVAPVAGRSSLHTGMTAGILSSAPSTTRSTLPSLAASPRCRGRRRRCLATWTGTKRKATSSTVGLTTKRLCFDSLGTSRRTLVRLPGHVALGLIPGSTWYWGRVDQSLNMWSFGGRSWAWRSLIF